MFKGLTLITSFILTLEEILDFDESKKHLSLS